MTSSSREWLAKEARLNYKRTGIMLIYQTNAESTIHLDGVYSTVNRSELQDALDMVAETDVRRITINLKFVKEISGLALNSLVAFAVKVKQQHVTLAFSEVGENLRDFVLRNGFEILLGDMVMSCEEPIEVPFNLPWMLHQIEPVTVRQVALQN